MNKATPSPRTQSPADALNDARSLVRFLLEVYRLDYTGRAGLTIEALDGRILILDLLHDKIEIGCRVYDQEDRHE